MNIFIQTKERYKRKRQQLRIRLGFLQLIHKPVWNLLWLPMAAAFLLTAWGQKIAAGYLLSSDTIPEVLHPLFSYLLPITAFMFSILLVLAMLEWIGERTARWHESCLVVAFEAKHLIHKCPVLMDIYRVKGTGVTVLEFYSLIPYKAWIEKKDDIADAMNIHFVEEIQYSGNNRNRIILKTARGLKSENPGVLYDEEL